MYIFTTTANQITDKSGLVLKVSEEDVGSNELVGESALVPLKDIFSTTAKAQTVKILYKGKEAGTVNIETTWTPLKKDKNAKDTIYNGKINFLIKNATITRNLDTFTKMDPLVQIDLKDWPATYRGPKQYKTKTLEGAGKTPAWNENIRLSVPLLKGDLLLPTTGIVFRVVDEDVTNHDVVGESTLITLKEIFAFTASPR